MISERKWKILMGLWLPAVLFLFGQCTQSESPADSASKTVLHIARSSDNEDQNRLWTQVAGEFEKAHPGVQVKLTVLENDIYETIGLPTLLIGENPPDLFMEWEGYRLKVRLEEGFASDLTDALNQEDWKNLFYPATLQNAEIDGRYYLIPVSTNVTNVIWYNRTIFQDFHLGPPETWKQFLHVCETLKQGGVIPIAIGNLDLWVAGNWLGHMVSRVVGEDAYIAALNLNRPFCRPDFIKAFGYIQELWERGYVNTDLNGISDDEGLRKWFDGRAGMTPNGSWVVGSAMDQAPPAFDYSFFNHPAMPDGRGDPTSIMGVTNGYVINKKTQQFDLAVKFLKVLTSPNTASQFAAAGMIPSSKVSFKQSDALPQTVALAELFNRARNMVAPPDTGFDLETARFFNMAVAKVLGGAAGAEEALAELDMNLKARRRSE